MGTKEQTESGRSDTNGVHGRQCLDHDDSRGHLHGDEYLFAANTSSIRGLVTQQNLRVAMNAITRDLTMAGTGFRTAAFRSPTEIARFDRPARHRLCNARRYPRRRLPTPNNVVAILAPGDAVGSTVAEYSHRCVDCRHGRSNVTDMGHHEHQHGRNGRQFFAECPGCGRHTALRQRFAALQ